MPVPGKRDELYPGPGLSDPFAQCESDRTTKSASIFNLPVSKANKWKKYWHIFQTIIYNNVAATAILSKGGWKVTAKWL